MTTASLLHTMDSLAPWHERMRAQFPQITSSPHAFLDSSATSQKPQAVLDAVAHYLTTSNANAGRGSYPWANQTTAMIEATRNQVKCFLHDPDPNLSSVHFTSGATESLQRVATDWLTQTLRDGDEIIIPAADHRANVVPWTEVASTLQRRGIDVVVHHMPYEPSGDYDSAKLADLINPRTRFIAATHVHHVYGVDMNVHRIRAAAGESVVICLDAAQSVGHLDVSVTDLDVDFVAFAGHKAMALPGVGVLWSRNLRTEHFAPSGWSGSPNTVGVVSLSAALNWLSDAGLDRIDAWTQMLGAQLTDGLSQMESFTVLGCQASLSLESDVQRRQGIVTFRHRDIPAGDLGFILERQGYLVRADHHCQASPESDTPSVRVSTHVYTSTDEIAGLLSVLEELDKESRWQ